MATNGTILSRRVMIVLIIIFNWLTRLQDVLVSDKTKLTYRTRKYPSNEACFFAVFHHFCFDFHRRIHTIIIRIIDIIGIMNQCNKKESPQLEREEVFKYE